MTQQFGQPTEEGVGDNGDEATTFNDLEDANLQLQQLIYQKQPSRSSNYIYMRIQQMLKDGSLVELAHSSKLIMGGVGFEKQRMKKKHKQWQAKYANLVERTIDVIFDSLVGVRIYCAKIVYKKYTVLLIERKKQRQRLQQQQRLAEEEEEEHQHQRRAAGDDDLLQPQRNLKGAANTAFLMRQRTNLLGHLKETHEFGISNDGQFDEGIKLLLDNSKLTDINKYLAYQSSLNTLDRIEQKEMQVFTETPSRTTNESSDFLANINHPSSSSSSSNTGSAIFDPYNQLLSSSTAGPSKFLFPFSNYLPNYDQPDLAQLNISQHGSQHRIDAFLKATSTYVMCFTQYNDQLFALALSNGVIQIRDLLSLSVYEVNHHLHYYNKQYISRGRDILGLEFLPDLKQILAYHASGAISLYHFKQNKLVCFLPNAFKYGSSYLEENPNTNLAIIDLKILAQEEEDGFEIICIAANAHGDSCLLKIKKGFLSYEIAETVSILRGETFPSAALVPLSKRLQLMYLPPSYGKDHRDYTMVAVVSPQKLYILQIKLQKMKVKSIFKFVERQDSPVRNPKCSFTWAESLSNPKQNQPPSLIFLVSFTSTLYLCYMKKNEYERHPLSGDDSRNGMSKFQFEMCKRIKHYTSILFVGALYRNLFLICDYNKRVYLVNAVDLAKSAVRFFSLSNLNSYKAHLPSKINIRPINYDLDERQLLAQRIMRRQSTATFSAARKRSEALPIRSTFDEESLTTHPNQQNHGNPSAEEYANIIDSGQLEQRMYNNSVSFSLATQTCYVLCEKDGLRESQFLEIGLVPWRSTLENLVQRKQYFNAMHFLHVLREDRHKFAHNSFQRADLRDLLAPQIERVALNLCSLILSGRADDENQRLPEFFDVCATTHMNKSNTTEPSSKEGSKKSSFADDNRKLNQDMKPPIIYIIEFLIACDQAEYVFEEIRSMCFKQFSSMELYVECLEPFILEGKISSVPNEVLTDIIGFYEKKKNMRMIQQVLTSLDVHNLDTKPLISLTLERQLIPALIYLSTRQREPDFVTPLMSFWNSFVNSLRKWEEQFRGKSLSFSAAAVNIHPNQSSQSHTTLSIIEQLANEAAQKEEMSLFIKEQVMLSNVSDLTKVQTEYLGLRTLWFFRLSMQQRLIDGEYIGDEDYVQVTLAFEIWLSYRDNIRICLLRWPEVFFDVLKAFFAAKALRILNHDHKKVELAAKTSKEISESANPTAKAVSDFCASTRNVSPSECLLRQIIQETIEVDKLFSIAEKLDDVLDLCSISSNLNTGNQSRSQTNHINTTLNTITTRPRQNQMTSNSRTASNNSTNNRTNSQKSNEESQSENARQQSFYGGNRNNQTASEGNSFIRSALSVSESNQQDCDYLMDQSMDLAQYTRQSQSYLLADSSDKLSVILSLRRKNLLSSFHLFLAYLFYESQCRDDSGYLGGKFSFKPKKVIEIVFYLAKYHKILLKLEFSKQDLYRAARMYIKDASSLTGKHSGFRSGATLGGHHSHDINSNESMNSQGAIDNENNPNDMCNYMELAQVLRSEFLLSLIKSVYPQLSERERGELSQLLDATELVTARSHVLLLREQYHRAIECYIDSTNKIMRNLVFEWMELNLTQSQVEDEQKFLLLKEIMRKKLPDFIRIDSEKTHILFQRFLNGAEQDIISKLSDNPALQLLYISNVVKQHKQELAEDPTYADRIKVDMQILILQISLMCQLNHPEEAVLSEITNFDFYPLKDILTICLDKQYMEASCYIYLRMGQTDMAIRAQIKILESVMRDYKRYLEDFCKRISNMAFDKVSSLSFLIAGENRGRHQSYLIEGSNSITPNNNNQNPLYPFNTSMGGGDYYGGHSDDSYNMSGAILGNDSHALSSSQDFPTAHAASARVARYNARIDRSITKLFSMCTNNKAYDRPVEYWFLLLDLLVEIGKKYEEMDRNDSLVQMRTKFQQVIGSSIMEIAQHIPMEELIEKIRDAETKVNIADLKSTFSKLLRLSIDANSILQRSLNYLLEDYLNTTIYASKEFIRATSSTNFCASCLDPLTSLDIIRRKVMQSAILTSTRKSLIESETTKRRQSTIQYQQEEKANRNQSYAGAAAAGGGLQGDNNLGEQVDDNDEDDNDSNQPKVITFYCGHSYHSECYYRQRNVHICTECLKQKRSLFFLMTQRKDVGFAELLAFIKSQQQELESQAKQRQDSFMNRMGNRNPNAAAFKRDASNGNSGNNSRASSSSNPIGSTGRGGSITSDTNTRNERIEAEEKKQFKKVKALAKLRNFDKNQIAKYNAIQPDRPPQRRRHKS